MSSFPPSRVTRRNLLTSAAALGGAALLPKQADALAPSDLRVELQSFVVPGLHPAHDGLRIAQLSDLHVGHQTGEEIVRSAISTVNRHLPDLVVLTGDYLTYSKAGLGLMKSQLGGLKAPVISILGNHDHWVSAAGAKAALVGHGYAVLQNQFETITLRGEPFTVIGIDDLMTRHADIPKAFSGTPAGSRLVLAHIPHTADLLATRREPMLVLSGHTHGGQIYIPGLTAAVLRVVAHERYERGRYNVGPVQLYVNRGVGNSGMPVRMNSAPEITLLTLRAPRPAA
jgi:predicted MPP superfamily phosphohydrolase